MTHIDIKNYPFALSMLPFFAVGIVMPATIQDWYYGCLMLGDKISLSGGLLIVCVWECAILFSVRTKKSQGQTLLLGRKLDSWYWAPPVTFLIGIVSGLIFS